MEMNNKTQNAVWLMTTVVAILAVVGVGSGIAHFLRGPTNPGFLEYPNLVKTHAALGAVYLALAPFQFLTRVRSRWIGYHRIAGRVLTSIGLVIGLSAIFIGLFIPFSGLPEQIIISIFGVFYVTSLVKGFLCIRSKKIAEHREWMIRAFSIGLSIATMRLVFIPALIFIGADDATARTLSIVSFSITLPLHAVVAELWIRHTRKRTPVSAIDAAMAKGTLTSWLVGDT